MTLKEIAQQANVSISTVSRVINGKCPSAASPEVQQRILSIASQAGYTPNTTAQNLKTGKYTAGNTSASSKSIAILFARTPFALNDPFFSRLIQSIEAATTGSGFFIKYMYSALDFEDPSIIHSIENDKLNGIIILGRCSKKIVDCLKRTSINLVCVGLNEFDYDYDQVICEGSLAAYMAVEYLIKRGHRHIGYIGEAVSENRYEGYRRALESNGIALNPNYIAEVTLSSEEGYIGAKKIFSQPSDISALFCANDTTAIGAMRALKEIGRNIPDDISIIGIDDIPTSQYISPSLTTVHIPIDELGNMTFKILRDRIEGGHTLPVKVLLPFNIVERETCASPLSSQTEF